MAEYRPLPDEALKICQAAKAPPRLVAHLTLVHDVACDLVAEIQIAFPKLRLDAASIFFGAATHDIGKSIRTEELTGPGTSHESEGVEMLKELGVSEQRAQFAYTHGNWSASSQTSIEDLVVALADNCWKGKSVSELETQAVNAIADETGQETWQVFSALDEILQKLAADADHRLAWQAQFPSG
jgi:putative nucleotidyltransferase with HDIG domain